MSKEKEKVLIRREVEKEDGGLMVSYDYLSGGRDRDFELDAQGRYHGYYSEYKDGERILTTHYDHGVENGHRAEKMQHIEEPVYKHTLLSSGIPQKIYYTDAMHGYHKKEYRFEEVGGLLADYVSKQAQIAQSSPVEKEDIDAKIIEVVLDQFIENSEMSEFDFAEDLKDIFAFYMSDRSTLSSFANEVCQYGCGSGLIGDFIYYSDTKEFYVRHMDDIEDYINELGEELGETIKLEHTRYNSATWLVAEEFASHLSNYLEDTDLRNVLSDYFEEQSFEDLITISNNSQFGEVRDAVNDFLVDYINEEEIGLPELLSALQKTTATDVQEAISDRLDEAVCNEELTSDELLLVSESESLPLRLRENAKDKFVSGDFKEMKDKQEQKRRGPKL